VTLDFSAHDDLKDWSMSYGKVSTSLRYLMLSCWVFDSAMVLVGADEEDVGVCLQIVGLLRFELSDQAAGWGGSVHSYLRK
jgi:hypothetical protein